MRYVYFIGFLMVISTSSFAQQRSVYNESGRIESYVYDSYKQQIQALKAQLSALANEIGDLKDCHASGNYYNTAGNCVSPFSAEIDPLKQLHTTKSIATCPTNQIQYYDNGDDTWKCREVRKQQDTSTYVPPRLIACPSGWTQSTWYPDRCYEESSATGYGQTSCSGGKSLTPSRRCVIYMDK